MGTEESIWKAHMKGHPVPGMYVSILCWICEFASPFASADPPWVDKNCFPTWSPSLASAILFLVHKF